jgi:hypothetical protein
MSGIAKQIDYFKANKDDLVKRYLGKIIVISEEFVITECNNEEEAFDYGVTEYGYGNFLLKNLQDASSSRVHIISPTITSVTSL